MKRELVINWSELPSKEYSDLAYELNVSNDTIVRVFESQHPEMFIWMRSNYSDFDIQGSILIEFSW